MLLHRKDFQIRVSTYYRIIKYFVFLLSDGFLLIEIVGDFKAREKKGIFLKKSNINPLLGFQTCV